MANPYVMAAANRRMANRAAEEKKKKQKAADISRRSRQARDRKFAAEEAEKEANAARQFSPGGSETTSSSGPRPFRLNEQMADKSLEESRSLSVTISNCAGGAPWDQAYVLNVPDDVDDTLGGLEDWVTACTGERSCLVSPSGDFLSEKYDRNLKLSEVQELLRRTSQAQPEEESSKQPLQCSSDMPVEIVESLPAMSEPQLEAEPESLPCQPVCEASEPEGSEVPLKNKKNDVRRSAASTLNCCGIC
mmetsp:Transcript_54494/g.117983  ORF Transcript_54494/g.117983 Transcript_54494/m.117983 type:complete len:248 (+) Transcript_54494:84-827(+)